MKKLLLLSVLFLLVGCTQQSSGVGATVDIIQKPVAENLKLKVPKERVLDSVKTVEVDENGTEKEVTVYAYYSDEVVSAEKGEDISKRTANTKVFPTEKPNEYTAKIYSGQPFYKLANEWRQTEVATTTPEAFLEQTKVTLLDKVKYFFTGEPAKADNFFSGAGDGFAGTYPDAWATIHAAASSGSAYYTATTILTSSGAGSTSFPNEDQIYRSFLPFNTSAIPSGASITAATLNLYVTAKQNEDNDGNDYINVIQTTQASNTTLAVADFDQAGAVTNPTEGATAIDIGSISTSAYNTWTLNATGLTWIKISGQNSVCGSGLTGWSCLGIREGHDMKNSEPTGGALSVQDEITTNASEATGTANDPYLSVTYTAGGLPDSVGCFHLGGDWYINQECWIDTSTSTEGYIYLTEAGSLNCIGNAVISAKGISGKRGTKTNAKQGCQFQFSK